MYSFINVYKQKTKIVTSYNGYVSNGIHFIQIWLHIFIIQKIFLSLTLSLRRHLNNAPSCYTEHYKI